MKRATKDEFISADYKVNFNPRPREEGDLKGDKNFNVPRDFNPRPREEGDSFHYLYCTKPVYFNPRPREEGDFAF